MNVKGLALAAGFALALTAAVPPADAVEGDETGVRLGLDEALRVALENNLDLVMARKDPKIAEQRIEASNSAFDPRFEATATYPKSEIETTTSSTAFPVPATASGSSDAPSLEANWRQKLSIGASYGIRAFTRKTDVSPQRFFDARTGLSGTFASEADSWNLGADFTLPLLRGFGSEANTESVLLARSNVTLSRHELRLRALTTMTQVESAYWNLVAARAALDVARRSLTLAQDLLELNRKKVEVGTLAPIEITQAEAGVASREEGVIVAENVLEAAEDELLRLLAIPANDPRWEARIVPTDVPDRSEPTVSAESAIMKALALRPEIFNARQVVEDRLLSERVAANQVRHRLDFTASVNQSEDDSTDRAVFDDPSFPASVGSRLDKRGPDWSAALIYGYPIGNREANAAAATARLNREKAEVSLQSVEQTIRVDVRNAVRNVESGIKRVKAAESSTVLQEKKLEAEQKKFENGMSTSFEVLTFQTDLANAQLSEVRAKLDYMKSLADLERAQGTLLEARGLRLDAGETR